LRPRPSVVALVVGVGAVWVLAAAQLWDTTVPDGLSIPDVDVHEHFTAAELARAERYERFLRIDLLLSQATAFAVLALFAARGTRFMRESASGRIGTGMLLGMLGLGFLWIADLPFALAAQWWQRRYDVSQVSYGEWLLEHWLGLGGGFLFVSLALLIVMGLAGVLRDRWWVGAAPVFVSLAALFAFVYPYLIPDLEPLRDPALQAEARSIAREQGIEPVPVEVQEVSGWTTAPNAQATGIGESSRVILWDTLLQRFDDDEVEVVLAHELGHVSREHVLRGIGWYALLAVPGVFILALATRRRGGLYDPRAVPLALLVLVALQFAAQPFENVVSRRLEAEADWIALETTDDADSAVRLFEGFTTEALADPDPPAWAYVLLDTHPSVAERIGMVEAWATRSSRR
jgi:Zn-dependent protease with chaperone function